MKFAVRDHRGNSAPLMAALLAAGHELVTAPPADVLLIDHDVPRPPYSTTIAAYAASGAKAVLYPHGANPSVAHDEIVPPDRRVAANLVIGEGHAEVMRRYGYPHPVHVIGWPFGDLRPFRPCERPRRLLFAPQHPDGEGRVHAENLRLNRDLFRRALELPGVELTVRHLGTIGQNGLWHVDGVNWSQAESRGLLEDIDAADAVVAAFGSFPWHAIARGVPTVMFGQDAEVWCDPAKPPCHPGHRELYRDYMRYPLDADHEPLGDVLARACADEEPIAEWKRLFVGSETDPVALAGLVESIAVPAPAPAPGARSFAALAFAAEVAARPGLLAAYAAGFGVDEDATLVLYAPGETEETVLAPVQAAIAAAGLDEDRLPDVVLLPVPDAGGESLLAGGLAALLSEREAGGAFAALPRFGAAEVAGLRALAERQWASATPAA